MCNSSGNYKFSIRPFYVWLLLVCRPFFSLFCAMYINPSVNKFVFLGLMKNTNKLYRCWWNESRVFVHKIEANQWIRRFDTSAYEYIVMVYKNFWLVPFAWENSVGMSAHDGVFQPSLLHPWHPFANLLLVFLNLLKPAYRYSYVCLDMHYCYSARRYRQKCKTNRVCL